MKTFFDLIYKEKTDDERIALAHDENGEFVFKDVNNVDELIFEARKFMNHNVFFGLPFFKANTESHTDSDVLSTNFIALDLDFGNKEKPDVKELTKSIRDKINLFITAVIDSGHGFHIYIQINKTTDIDKWHDTTKRLQVFLDADCLAIRKSQIMRFPSSTNFKAPNKLETCSLVYVHEGRPYTLDHINKLLDVAEKNKEKNEFLVLHPCVQNMLNGVDNGRRNLVLSFIVPELKRLNMPKQEAVEAVLSFNKKCSPSENENKVLGSFEALWNGIYTFPGCNFKDSTKNQIVKEYCPGSCIFITNKPKTPEFEEKKTRVDVPQFFLSPENLKEFNGAETSILLKTFLQQEFNFAKLKKFWHSQSINKYIEHLIDKKFLKIAEKNTVCVDKNINRKITIDKRVIDLCLNKKISKNEAKIYYCIAYLNSINGSTTVSNIARMLNLKPNNISGIIRILEEKELISISRIDNHGYHYFRTCA